VFVAVIVVAYMIVVLRDSVQYRAMHFDIPSVSVSVCLSVCLFQACFTQKIHTVLQFPYVTYNHM